MKYEILTVYTSEEGLSAVTAKLLSIGFANVEICDPQEVRAMERGKRATEWIDLDDPPRIPTGEAYVRLYLPADGSEEGVNAIRAAMEELKVLREKREISFALGSLRVETAATDDAEWKDRWKEFFKPTRVTENIVVKPTWETYTPKAGDIVLAIDPGMAFGTGTHETTALALKFLQKYLRAGDAVLDVGTGSGILSIAAAKCGASAVCGIDIDEDAVRVANENLALNGIAKKIAWAQQGDLTAGVDFQGDLVVANLLAHLVIALSAPVRRNLKRGGIFISSGILDTKAAEVEHHLQNCGFTILETARDGEWCAIAAKMK